MRDACDIAVPFLLYERHALDHKMRNLQAIYSHALQFLTGVLASQHCLRLRRGLELMGAFGFLMSDVFPFS